MGICLRDRVRARGRDRKGVQEDRQGGMSAHHHVDRYDSPQTQIAERSIAP